MQMQTSTNKTIIYKPQKGREWVIEQIYGNCLERAGLHIPNKGIAIIHQGGKFKVGDLVHCTKMAGAQSSYIKQVKEINGDTVIVGTAYIDSTKDFSFEAGDIFGVVTEVYDALWKDRVYKRK